MKNILLKGGLAGAVNWYRVITTNIDAEDDRSRCFPSLTKYES
jgi:hypothetical protein